VQYYDSVHLASD
jgi:chromosome segregation ATPase